jgi:phosphoglycerate dehydrogenase-like enzyme
MVLLRCRMVKPVLGRALAGAPALEWIHTCTAGFDQLLIPEVEERRIVVSRSAKTMSVQIGEFVLAYILVCAKRIPQLVHAQREHRWSPPDTVELAGATVGVVGAGAIGAEVAWRCDALGMRVIGTKRTPMPLPHFERVLPSDELPALLRESDYVVLACPLTAETQGMIGEAELRLMKPTAYLLNVARGALIVERDLLRALREEWIAGACLDAFEAEPLQPESALWDGTNLFLTPHCSYVSPNIDCRALAEFKVNLAHYLAGEPLENVFDRARGY